MTGHRSDALPRRAIGRPKDESADRAIVAATLVSEITIPDTGSTREDLLALMQQAVDLYSGSLAPRLMPSLVDEARRNPELGRTVREEFLAARRAALSGVLKGGIEPGDLSRGLDLDLAWMCRAAPPSIACSSPAGQLTNALPKGSLNSFCAASRLVTKTRLPTPTSRTEEGHR
jgi:hypothetical protein